MTPRKYPDQRLRAVGYIRVSSQQQADSDLSLEDQEAKIRAAATAYDLELTDVIVDAAESAESLDRSGLQRMLELVRTKLVDAVIVLTLDRLTRSVRDLADLLALFSRRKVALISASESLNTETAAGRMVVSIMGVVAQWEPEAIAERTEAAWPSRVDAASVPAASHPSATDSPTTDALSKTQPTRMLPDPSQNDEPGGDP